MTNCDTSSNPLLTNYFKFTLSRVPNMTYFCQTANLPGIGFGTALQPTNLGYPIKRPTGAVMFEDLLLTFKVDENLANWRELHNWIYEISNYNDDASTKREPLKTSEANLVVTNSSYRPNYSIIFREIFPVYLSGLDFSVTQPQSTPVVAAVRFSYTDYIVSAITS